MFLLLGVLLYAQDVGVLVFKKGIVKVKHPGSIIKKSIKQGYKIQTGDTVYTYNSLAKIKLNDGSIIKLGTQSEVRFAKKIEQKSGKVYYKVKHRKVGSFEVVTNFTTIGVKGTVFLVDSNSKAVALKKGVISLSAKSGRYAVHKMKSEFDDFKRSFQQEFEEYKNKMEKEFVEYKKSFIIKSNTMVVFRGNNAYEKKLDPRVFKFFESF